MLRYGFNSRKLNLFRGFHRSASRYSSSGAITANNRFFNVSEEIREAIHSGRPVVALETTIYTHGFPYPDNVALASELESIVRVNGGIPATIGIIDGVAHVGLSPEEIIRVASSAGEATTLKLSRRDLAYACGLKLAGRSFNGGTTIAATMILAHLAGIKVFATGGLGGVHRGAESSMDISADLTELGRTPVAVISSGCKSFLDIPRTLEYLETQGVGVATFADGRDMTKGVDFPAFWARDSGSRSPMTIKDELEAAAIIHAQFSFPLASGLHFANPIPTEAAIPKAEMDVFIDEAIKYADAAGASGKDNTPFVLNKIKELTGGKSVKANRALIASNVKRGTLVAIELAKLEVDDLQGKDGGNQKSYKAAAFSKPIDSTRNSNTITENAAQVEIQEDSQVDVLVAGALAVDYACNYAPLPSVLPTSSTPSLQTSNPARITQTLGGVAHNIAKAAHYLGARVQLCSVVGADLAGRTALQQLESDGLRTSGIVTIDSATARTAQYVAVNDTKKDLVLAMADMDILEQDSAAQEDRWRTLITATKPKYVVVDANWSPTSLSFWLTTAKSTGALTIFEPVSTAKSTRIFPPSTSPPLGLFPNHTIDIVTPNSHELAAMHAHARAAGHLDSATWFAVIDALGITAASGASSRFARAVGRELADQGVPQQCVQLLPFVPTLLVKLGARGVVLAALLGADDARLREPAEERFVVARSGRTGGAGEVGGVYLRHFEAVETVGAGDVVSVNGAGDTFLGAVVARLVAEGKGVVRVEDVVGFAQRAAVMSLGSLEAVSPALRQLC